MQLINPPGVRLQSVVKIFPFKSLKCLEVTRALALHSFPSRCAVPSFSKPLNKNRVCLFVCLFVCSLTAEENPSAPPGGTQRSLFAAGGFYLLEEPQLPGGTGSFVSRQETESTRYLVLNESVVGMFFCFLGAAFSVWRRSELCSALAGASHPEF